MVIARIGPEITLKRFHRRDEERIELQPRSTNPEHRPIMIDAWTEDWEIVGVVVGAMIGSPPIEQMSATNPADDVITLDLGAGDLRLIEVKGPAAPTRTIPLTPNGPPPDERSAPPSPPAERARPPSGTTR